VLWIWLIGVGIDRLWLWLDHGLPHVAQAQQLNRLWALQQAIQAGEMPTTIINPLIDGVDWLVQRWLGDSLDQLLWMQAGFNGLLLVSVYGLGQQLCSRQVGLWAAGFCVLLPVLLSRRLQFSLDLPLVAMVTLSLWRLRVWQPAAQFVASRLRRSVVTQPALEQVRLVPAARPWETELQLLRQTIVSRAAVVMPARSAWVGQVWLGWGQRLGQFASHLRIPIPIPRLLQAWLNAGVLGLTLGLAVLTHPLALISLGGPFVWAGWGQLWCRRWWAWCQWVLAGCIVWIIVWPWYRLNLPGLVLAGLRSPMIAVGAVRRADGIVLASSLAQLAAQVFYPLLLLGGLGLLLYHQRAFLLLGASPVRSSVTMRPCRRQLQRLWGRAIGWLLGCIALPLVIGSGWLSLGATDWLPVLPLMVILLTQGLFLFPRGGWQIRWLVLLGLIVWSIANLVPILPLRSPQQLPQAAENWHQAALLTTVTQASPGLHQTIGILPQTDPVNAAYLTYLSHMLHLPIAASRLGTEAQQIWQDRRSLSWYVLKTGNQGPVSAAQSALDRAIRQDPALKLTQRWHLPDGSELQLWQRQSPMVQIIPIVGAQWSEDLPLKLEKVTVAAQALSGQPISIEYTWVGRPADLQRGLVQVTWHRVVGSQPPSAVEQWWHDHAIGLGQLRPTTDEPTALMQVTEHTAMLAPAGAVGRYRLEVRYLNAITGEEYPLVPPDVSIELVRSMLPPLSPAAVPELDLITQLRSLARTLAQQGNMAAWRQVVGRLDRYDPEHQTLKQWHNLSLARLAALPQNVELLYDLALAQFLQGDMEGAQTVLQQLVQRLPHNPQMPLYEAIVAAAMGDAAAAQVAVDVVQQRQPDFVVPPPLQTLMAAVRGNLVARWRLYRLQLDLIWLTP
jgi:4-amino-4-deoxy-L-arabinose transferase-like glycosyltransferase